MVPMVPRILAIYTFVLFEHLGACRPAGEDRVETIRRQIRPEDGKGMGMENLAFFLEPRRSDFRIGK